MLTDKVVLVADASGGAGAEIAKLAAALGAGVAGNDLPSQVFTGDPL